MDKKQKRIKQLQGVYRGLMQEAADSKYGKSHRKMCERIAIANAKEIIRLQGK